MASPLAAPDRTASVYRFGPFEADVRNAELRKFGIRVRVERKPWQLLLALLRTSGQLVARAELERQLWPDGVFVDFEHGLNVAVKKLRAALCDSAEEPHYIETVAREGYRFIAAVETIADLAASEVPALAEQHPRIAEVSRHEKRGVNVGDGWRVRGARLLWAAMFLITVSVAAGTWYWWHSAHSLRFTTPSWVLIADFENRTGERLLDGTLEAALEGELSNSQFVRIAPRERADDALRLMRQPLNSRINRALGREICLRDGDIHALITGRVDKLGPTYVLSAEIVNPANGVTASSFEEEVPSEALLAPAVRRLSGRVRKALGEDPQLVQQSLEKLERVTTPSLRALQLFSQANRAIAPPGGGYDLAAPLLEEALKEDPNFASAHLWLSYAYGNLRFTKDPTLFEKQEQHMKRAMELAGTVSERERMFIEASYYQAQQRQADAVQAFETLVRAYPDHIWGQSNLEQMYSYYRFGRFDDVERAADGLIDLRPHDIASAIQAADMLTMYLWDKPASSEEIVRRVQDFNQKVLARVEAPSEGASSSDRARMALVLAAESIVTGEIARAKDEYEDSLRDHRAGDGLDMRLIVTAALLGRLHDAQRLGAELPPSVRNNLRRAGIAFLAGDRDGLRRLELLIAGDPTFVGWDDPVTLLVHSGMLRLAEEMHRKVREDEKKYQPQLFAGGKGSWARQEGELAFARGDTAEAITLLEQNDLQQEPNSISAMLAQETLTDAYRREHRLDDALRVLREGTAQWGRPMMLASLYTMRLRLKLLDVYRELGRVSDAERLEAQLRKQLTCADADNPMLLALQRRPPHPRSRRTSK